MGKIKCILGVNCPNQIAKRNVQFQLSEDDSDVGVKESCVFCGTYTAKKKKVVEASSSPWSSSSSDNFRMKRTAMTDIDSLSGIRSLSKKKKDDIDDRINFFRFKLLNEKKLSETLNLDSDSDDLSDSGVKSDYESPNVEVNNKKNDQINGLNVRKGRIISRSPSPETPANLIKSNGFNKNILDEKSNNSTLDSSLLGNQEVRNPLSLKTSNIVESDPFELDSEDETRRPSVSKDLTEAGPSSRPDDVINQSITTPNYSYEAHHSGFKSRFMNLTYLPKHKVERLLFKSFKLQILNQFSSSSDEDEIKIYQPPKKSAKRKRKAGQSAPVKDSKFTSSQKIGSGFYRWKKRRRFGNSWSDEDSNLTVESYGEEGTDDDDEEEDEYDVRPLNYSNQTNNEHDYSTSEFNKIAESNIDNLAFETEKLNWDDTVMIDDTTMDSVSGRRTPEEVITVDDSPRRFELPLVVPTDTVVVLDDDQESPFRSPGNDLNSSDHLYCVNELKKEPSPPKPRLENDKNADYDAEAPQNPPVPQNGRPAGQKKPWECPICLESANGQEISATHCGHMFCKDCIESYLGTSSTCPTCRRPLNKQNLITLYDM